MPAFFCLRHLVAVGICALGACAGLVPPLDAQERMSRRFAAGQGFKGAPVSALAQDGGGFLWIGGEDGLYRYDGTEFRHWAAGTIEGPVRSIATLAGRAVVLDDRGLAYEVAGDSAYVIETPLPAGGGQPNAVAFDAKGRLWMVRGGRIGYLEAPDRWHVLPADVFDREPPRFVRSSPTGEIGVATWSGVWQLDGNASAFKRLEATGAPDFVFLPGGGLAAMDTAIRVVKGEHRRIVDPFRGAAVRPRPVSLAERGGTLWVAYDRFLVALQDGRPPEIIGPDRGVESGGPLLVDHEGSLWMGSFTALLQYPEPETRIWNERSGLHSQHTRFVARSRDAIWVTTWQGPVLIRPAHGDSRWLHDWLALDELCEDASGGVWLGAPDGVIRVVGEQVVARHQERNGGTTHCARDPAGGVWLSLGGRLFRGEATGLHPVAAPPLPEHVQPVVALYRNPDAELWIGGGEAACRGVPGDSARINAWRCETLPRAGDVLAFHRTPSGSMWAATSRGGVFTLRDGAWHELPGNDMLPSRALLNLIPSPSGGVWILGHGVVWRVEEGEGGRPWTVKERLGEWHGLPVESGRDLHEDPDGRLWITTSLGVIEVPASARTPPARAPSVELVEVRVDEEAIATHGALDLPYRRNNLEVRFAVLSFRDPGRLRYEVRLTPRDAWRPASGRPWFRWIDIAPSRHRAELRASLDGERWTTTPAALSFRVHPPWYRTSGAMAAFAAAAVLLLWLAYRTRVGYLLGLERERTRIAMDLHDEMGSGLGSIGILSGLLATPGLEDGRGRDLARRIARTAQDLGGSLSGIIWSLDARSSTLGELASRLAEAGVNLLTPQGIAFTAELPDAWPSDPLSPRARRNLLLMGLEALHNAARHSRAQHVRLEFGRSGGRWEMRIADDGIGFEEPSLLRGGHGFGTMRRRAEEIGAVLEWDTGPGQGTTLALRFSMSLVRARRRSVVSHTDERSRSSAHAGVSEAPPSTGQRPTRGGGAA